MQRIDASTMILTCPAHRSQVSVSIRMRPN
jgi:hypothetical protein